MYRPYVYTNNNNNNSGNSSSSNNIQKTNCLHVHKHPKPDEQLRQQQRNWKLRGNCALKPKTSSNVANKVAAFPRKWCDFVFRRNADNSVYRSESFRFMQKTNSLEPLVPVGPRRIPRVPRARVPVSDDYVEPLDQLVLPSTHHSDVSLAPSSSLDHGWTSLTDPDEPPYHEIAEKYNAPYYYSDTLKGIGDSPVGVVTSEIPYSPPLPSLDSHRLQGRKGTTVLPCHCTQSHLVEGAQLMARKRYETAFLPVNSLSAAVSPDIDSLLSAIESTSVSDDARFSRPLTSGLTYVTAQTHVQYCRPDEDWSNQTSSPPPQKHMPLSEPLPQKKRYEFVQEERDSTLSTQSSSGWSSNASSSLSQNDNYERNPRKHSTRLTLLMKDNSISSLESIDSTKSEDMRLSRSKDRFQLQQNQGTTKILSPISDKSPLDPSSSSVQALDQKDGWLSHSYGYAGPSQTQSKMTGSIVLGTAVADQLAVPWEMPKLRRRLALLADSGISLDFPAVDNLNSSSMKPKFDKFPLCTQNQSSKGNLELRIPRMDSGEEIEEYQPFDGEEMENYQEDLRRPFPPPASANRVQSDKMRFDRCSMRLDFTRTDQPPQEEIDPEIELESQEWFHGHITRFEAENILRTTKEGSFLVRNCESSAFNRYSLSLKSARGFIHIRIEPNSFGTFSLAEQQFPSVSHLVLHFMSNRLPIKGAEHVKLKYPVIIQLL